MRRTTVLLLFSGLSSGCCCPPPRAPALQRPPGQSIQKAVDRAHDGDRIFIRPGIYREHGKSVPDRAQATVRSRSRRTTSR